MTQEQAASHPIFRFAPSPNGLLHLGHALSALLNLEMARKSGGLMLLRIEDIDRVRCTTRLENMMLEDLEWIGFEWDSAPRRQSEHFGEYRERLDQLEKAGLLYPSFATRAQLRQLSLISNDGALWPRDPDGSPFNPSSEKGIGLAERKLRILQGEDFSLRLDTGKAVAAAGKALFWLETGQNRALPAKVVTANPAAWGDVILARKDTPASYHLACVHDDAQQGITHVVRGLDLFHATSVHRLLQELFALPVPTYHHHRLVLAQDGRKLSKSRSDTALRHLREAGVSVDEIRQMLGLDPP